MALRIIGCGNLDRGDDAAGVLVARRLRAREAGTLAIETAGIETVEQTGESFSLMDCWTGCEHVILVDATAPSGTAGKIRVWNLHTDRLAEDIFPCSTHAFGVREAVELARAMNCLPQTLLIYGIEGKQFCFGTSPSPEVKQGVESVAQQLLELARTTMGPAHKTMSL